MLMKETKGNTNRWKDTTFLDWKTYCQNDYITQGNLQIQCSLCQITSGMFHTTERKMFYILHGNTKDPE